MTKKASETNVFVLGGGVIGLTTGIILKIHGYKVTLVSEEKFENLYADNLAERPPELASIHAAASVIPHSVNHKSSSEILAVSQKFFHRLAFSAGFGVRVQRHYEVFEEPTPPPEYARVVKDFTLLPDNGSGWVDDHNIPRRKGAHGVFGWYFNAFFAEVPTYMGALKSIFKKLGGNLEEGVDKNRNIDNRINSIEEIAKYPADFIINCLGRGSMKFFPNDKENTIIARGHMVKVGIHDVPHDNRDQYFSYNYHPHKDIYWREKVKDKRTGADVYFYPRSDGWLLGGSRQEGYPDVGQKWRIEDEQIPHSTFIDKDKKQKTVNLKWKLPHWEEYIPKPVWELNRELILDITGVDIEKHKENSFSYVGYRFVRNPIRIEEGNEIPGKVLIHNYGHGGAGYTLSWGSAYEVLKILQQCDPVKFELPNLKNLMPESYEESMVRTLVDLANSIYLNSNKQEFSPTKQE